MNLELFWAKVDKTPGCWNWTAAKDRDGYGVWSVRQEGKLKQYRVHRISLMQTHNGLDESLTVDHLCKNKACLNPEHLEQVTLAENIRRSTSFNGSKTHCNNGHEFTAENTYLRRGTHRSCKACHANNELQRYHKMKVAQ